MTKLHEAVLSNDYDLFCEELKRSTASHTLNKLQSDHTALHYAAQHGNFVAAFHLILKGASIDNTIHNKTALDLAIKNKHNHVALLLATQQSNIDTQKINELKNDNLYCDYLISITYAAIHLKAQKMLNNISNFIQNEYSFTLQQRKIFLALCDLAKQNKCDFKFNDVIREIEMDHLIDMQLNEFEFKIYQAACKRDNQSIEEFCYEDAEPLANVIKYSYMQNDFCSINAILSCDLNFHKIYNLLMQKNKGITQLLLINSFSFYNNIHHSTHSSSFSEPFVQSFLTAIKEYLINDHEAIAALQATNHFFNKITSPYSLNSLRAGFIEKESLLKELNACIDAMEIEISQKKKWHTTITFDVEMLFNLILFSLLAGAIYKMAKEGADTDSQAWIGVLCVVIPALFGNNVFFYKEIKAMLIENPQQRFLNANYLSLSLKNVRAIEKINKKIKTIDEKPVDESIGPLLDVYKTKVTDLNNDLNRMSIYAPAHFFKKPQIEIVVDDEEKKIANDEGKELTAKLLR